jgi:hypothetical protein
MRAVRMFQNQNRFKHPIKCQAGSVFKKEAMLRERRLEAARGKRDGL